MISIERANIINSVQIPRLLQILSWILHKYPFLRGSMRITNSKHLNHLFPKRSPLPVLTTLRNKVVVKIDINDFDGRMIFLFGIVEVQIIKLLKCLLSNEDLLLDIGANIGVVGLLCKDILTPDGEIHFFEPNINLSKTIDWAIKKNNIFNAYVHKCGLMDFDGELELNVPCHHSGAGTFTDLKTSHISDKLDKIICKVNDTERFLSPIIKDKNVGIKVDAEGSEIKILPFLMDQSNVKFIVLETEHISKESDISFISNSKMMIPFGIEGKWKQITLVKIRNNEQLWSFENVVCLNKEFYRDILKNQKKFLSKDITISL